MTDYEKTDRAELVDILHELDKHKEDLEMILINGNRFEPEFYESLTNLGCRRCMGERFEVPDPRRPTGKYLTWRGQALIGEELPCRLCVHLRKIMVGRVPFHIHV